MIPDTSTEVKFRGIGLLRVDLVVIVGHSSFRKPCHVEFLLYRYQPNWESLELSWSAIWPCTAERVLVKHKKDRIFDMLIGILIKCP